MIDRYYLPEFKTLWSEQNKFETFLKVEKAALFASEFFHIIPMGYYKAVTQQPIVIDVARIETIEKQCRHDVIAFLTFLEEQLGDSSKFIHFGLTSSDIIDTALALRLQQATDLIIQDLVKLHNILIEKAETYRHTLLMGRTHGVYAEPMTAGLFFGGHAEEFARNHQRLLQTREEISFGKLSGAVGTYEHISPPIEAMALNILQLKPEPIATQVIPRDRHAYYCSVLSLLAGAVERLVTNIRLYHQTEVGEIREGFAAGQKGSSAMPHKKNPILCENLCGLAKLVRSTVAPAMENIALWHERDISHSSVERLILPQATSLVGFMLRRSQQIVSELQVNTEIMEQRVNSNAVNSQKMLLAMVKEGYSRQEAYELIQKFLAGEDEEAKKFQEYSDYVLEHAKNLTFKKLT